MTNEELKEIAEFTMDLADILGIEDIGELSDLKDIASGISKGLECLIEERKAEAHEVGRSINLVDEIEKVTFNDPATVVFWKDGTKTVTKCCKGDTFNKETGLAMCIVRKLCNNRHYNDVFEKFCN